MSKPPQPHNRARHYIDLAKKHRRTRNPQSTSDVQGTLMSPAFWPKIYAEEGFCKFGMGRFFNEEIRKANARHDDRPASEHQFALWPDSFLPLLKRIDRAEVYVPSRDEWVALIPGEIRQLEVREAGDYLRKQGSETIRRGDLLLALADLMPDDDDDDDQRPGDEHRPHA